MSLRASVSHSPPCTSGTLEDPRYTCPLIVLALHMPGPSPGQISHRPVSLVTRNCCHGEWTFQAWGCMPGLMPENGPSSLELWNSANLCFVEDESIRRPTSVADGAVTHARVVFISSLVENCETQFNTVILQFFSCICFSTPFPSNKRN